MKAQKTLLTLVASLALLGSLGGCDNPDQKAARHISRGNALFAEGKLEKARIEYKNAARLKPVDAEPFYRIGLIHERKGDLRNAFINFMAAEQQDSRFFPAVLKIAQYFMAAERYDEARKRIDAVLTAEPTNAEAFAISAAVLLRQQNFDAAEEQARTALSHDSANISAHSALTGLYLAKKDIPKAIDAINEALKRNPDNFPLMVLRALVYSQANDIPEVVASYREIFRVKPDEAQFRADLATYLLKAKKFDEAEQALREGISALPKSGEMKRHLILFLKQQKGNAAAEAETKQMIAADPDNSDLSFLLAELYLGTDNTAKAIEILSQIVDRGRFDLSALNARTVLAQISVKQGDKPLAEKLVAAVLEKAPDNRAALFLRASLAFEEGAYQTAISDLRTILRNTPTDGKALLLLGETHLVQGHLDLAIDTLKKLADIEPLHFPARVRLAQMVNLNGDSKQAMELISFVTKAAPDYAIGWEATARIAMDAKDWILAREAIRILHKIEGQNLTATFLDGMLLDKNGKSGDALPKYKAVIEVDPSTPLAKHALSALMSVYEKQKSLLDAATYLESLKSEDPVVLTLVGKSYLGAEKFDESADAFDRAIETGTHLPEPYLDRARLYLKEKKTEEAAAMLRKGMAMAPKDVRAPLVLASLLSERGDHREAVAIYDALLARNPDLDIAANNMAQLIADYQFNDSAAMEKARKAAERFSGSTNPYLLDTLAWVYFRQGEVSLAQTIMERALNLAERIPPQIHYHYGKILAANGQKEKAMAEFEKATVDGAPYPGLDDARKMLKSK